MIVKITDYGQDEKNFVDMNQTKYEKYDPLVAYSITYTNPKTNGKNIDLLLKIKLIRVIVFYLFIIFIIFCFYILFINIISEYFLKRIDNLSNNLSKISL